MGGVFGVVAKTDCVADLYYGTDYHSHLGTRYGGMAVCNTHSIERAIHHIENSYFRTKFEDELQRFQGRGRILDLTREQLLPCLEQLFAKRKARLLLLEHFQLAQNPRLFGP